VHEFSTLVVQNRIQAELLRLATLGEARGTTKVVLSPSPTLADIADRVATHREAVSRELSRLAKLGLVRREGHGLALIDVPRLTALVREAKGD
jgi:CRP-like cAMP-binding protein